MHYRNGREAKNGDMIVALGIDNGIIEHLGRLKDATPGNDYCNGYIIPKGQELLVSGFPIACLCDCLHVDDLKDILVEKGLHKRPAGK